MMKLTKFRVHDFKSIRDSGEICCGDITTLIGINEAGKSNVLLALWKLNPARGGEIVFTSDMPVSKIAEYRTNPAEHWFIKAWFQIDDDRLLTQLSTLGNCSPDQIRDFSIRRNYNGDHEIDFYNYSKSPETIFENVKSSIRDFLGELSSLEEAGKGEEGFKDKIESELRNSLEEIDCSNPENDVVSIVESILDIKPSEMKTSSINPCLIDLQSKIKQQMDVYDQPDINYMEEATDLIMQNLPKFVYYANYGNLDSEIYLPRVIEDFRSGREKSEKSLAKQRTLKVLFEYVNLNPEEILEMGQQVQLDSQGKIRELTQEEILKGQKQTKEREILLNSASAKLTSGFRDWWKQGNYIFDLQADGDFFRIWVSDDKRPAKISLEDRSTGLQWFLSFYLVFLVESKDSHKNCILLLDEAGTSLHPLAQKDLLKFFENLSSSNQLLTTTHSPFLVDIDNLERTKVVYIDDNGYTIVSDDLRASEKGATATGAVFAVHAALGLSISEGMLNGCEMVIVEGTSDQFYLNSIKQYLIAVGKINPNREIIFMPAGGVKSVKQLTSLVAGKQESLPVVILDSDKAGEDYKNKLLQDLYQEQPEKVISIGSILNRQNAEIEDLMPEEIMTRPVEFLINNRDFNFENEYDNSQPIIRQIEKWGKEFNVDLPLGYKVQLAKDVKQEMLKSKFRGNVNDEYVSVWKQLFDQIISSK